MNAIENVCIYRRDWLLCCTVALVQRTSTVVQSLVSRNLCSLYLGQHSGQFIQASCDHKGSIPLGWVRNIIFINVCISLITINSELLTHYSSPEARPYPKED